MPIQFEILTRNDCVTTSRIFSDFSKNLIFQNWTPVCIKIVPNADLNVVSLVCLRGSKKPPGESSEGPMFQNLKLDVSESLRK